MSNNKKYKQFLKNLWVFDYIPANKRLKNEELDNFCYGPLKLLFESFDTKENYIIDYKDYSKDLDLGLTSVSGLYNSNTKSITIFINFDYGVTIKTLVTYCLHEIGHYIDHKNGLFPNYFDKDATLDETLDVAYEAETHADQFATYMIKKKLGLTPIKEYYKHITPKKLRRDLINFWEKV